MWRAGHPGPPTTFCRFCGHQLSDLAPASSAAASGAARGLDRASVAERRGVLGAVLRSGGVHPAIGVTGSGGGPGAAVAVLRGGADGDRPVRRGSGEVLHSGLRSGLGAPITASPLRFQAPIIRGQSTGRLATRAVSWASSASVGAESSSEQQPPRSPRPPPTPQAPRAGTVPQRRGCRTLMFLPITLPQPRCSRPARPTPPRPGRGPDLLPPSLPGRPAGTRTGRRPGRCWDGCS
jgi:hypothetical protein